jgi:polysaccharide biosynthesis/export protein
MHRTFCVAVLTAIAIGLCAPEGEAQASPAVTIQPGDVIRVQIWREDDLSGDYSVDERGYIVLPLVGERRVAGMALGELRDTVIADFRAHLRNPSINIVPLRRVNVMGEVGRPGVYLLDTTTSLVGVIAAAGGVTPGGDMGRIRVLRDGEVMRERVDGGSSLAAMDIRSGDQVIVDRRGWFERNSTFMVSTALSLPGIILGFLALADALK